MQEGWKYFDLGNLNELFSIKYNQLRDSGQIDEAKLMEEDLSEEFSRPHSRNLSMSLIIEEQNETGSSNTAQGEKKYES